MKSLVGLLALLPLLACSQRTARPTRLPAPPTPSAQLATLSETYWQQYLKEYPVTATFLGDRRYDRLLTDLSEKGYAERRKSARDLLAKVQAVDEAPLTTEERVTRDVLITLLQEPLTLEVCALELWDVNALDGVQSQLSDLAQFHAVTTPEQAQALAERYRQARGQMNQHLDNLRRGLSSGYSASKPSVERVISQLKRMLADKPEASSFITLVTFPEAWPEAQKQRVREDLITALGEGVYPALGSYLEFLESRYLAKARAEVGVKANPQGTACYQARIATLTGSSLTPDEIHNLGLAQVALNETGMKAIARKRVKSTNLAALRKALQKDRTQIMKTREEAMNFNRQLLDKASAALPQAFSKISPRKLEVKQVEAFREKDSPAGYYYEGTPDGSRPGYYYLNTYKPEERLRYTLEPLAFHEGVPGHHLQIALAQDLEGLPQFRRLSSTGAYVEGWAHYAELLADELGLYSGDAGRYGMYEDQSMRAARLVVDSGLHALDWSRDKAITYMMDHAALTRTEAEIEVDRYIVWPGQALTYKLGQLEILSLRAEAKEQLKEQFDLKAFHEQVLGQGSLPLPVLRRVVKEWLVSEAAKVPTAPQAEAAQ